MASGSADRAATADLHRPTEVARALLAAYRTDGSPGHSLSLLADVDDAALQPIRADRERALAFWINLYNAGTQRLLTTRPELYESSLQFLRFFRAPCLTVAGTELGLDDIEQGILRGRSKYGLGYLPRLLAGSFETRYRVDGLDPRIHFALNCGAGSCPPIRAYDHGAIDDQLDQATRSYLEATVEYDPAAGTVAVPRLFLWYRGDFGGKAGTVAFLREYDVIPAHATPSVRYQSWDWSRAGDNFVT